MDPLAALRSELALQGQAPADQPDDEMLRVMLDVEGGDVGRAARAISDAHIAEHRRSSEVSMREPAPTAVPADAEPREEVVRTSAWDSTWMAQVWRVVTMPFSVVQAVLMVCLRALRIIHPLPRGGASGRFEMSRFSEDPRESARSWITELEKETNGTCEDDATDRPLLPSFYAGSYADALRQAKDQIQILAIVLTSEAHSDDRHFKTHVLTDRALVQTLRQSDFCVWGGDVRSREGFQVATLLRASTYPFVAFVALQPRRSRSRGAVVAHPAVLSRLEGSPHSVLSAQSICTHIQEVLLPRTSTYLGQLRGERHHREMERQLKADQDRAYEEASRRDQERVLARRAEKEKEEEQARAREAVEALRAARLEKERHWRRWARHHLVPAEAAPGEASVRVSVHLPNGKNLQRRFRPSDTLEGLYAFVDAAGAEGEAADAPSDYEHVYPFQLVQTYPRHVLDTQHLSTQLVDVSGLGPSANLIVEGQWGGDDEPSDSSDDDEP